MSSVLGALITDDFIEELKDFDVVFRFKELFSTVMKNKKISKTELARRMGVNKSHVTNLFQQDNITTKTIASIMEALDEDLYLSTHTLEKVRESKLRAEYTRLHNSIVISPQNVKSNLKRKKSLLHRKMYANGNKARYLNYGS